VIGAWIMAGVTFREAARKKVLWMALAAGLAFLCLFGCGLYFEVRDFGAHDNPIIRREGVKAFIMVGLYAVDALAIVMTVLTSIDTLSGELASGTIQAVATKPISRWEVLLGKWLGFVGMLTLYVVFMVGGVAIVTYAMSWHTLGGVLPHNMLRGAGLIWLECVLMLCLTFRLGTSFSTLTNGVVALGLHGIAFIGGWIEQTAALTHSPRALYVGIAASLIMPSESLWRRAAFEMQSPVLNALGFSPFSAASVPSGFMIDYACLYMIMALALAVRNFYRRDL
jgi:ABC-type transport system involved in multi-copper enzyme maturation permease subunit